MSTILTYRIFLPVLGSGMIFLFRRGNEAAIRIMGLLTGIAVFILSIFLFFAFDPARADMQFIHKVSWIPSLNVSYNVGVDGLSLLLLMLTAFLTPLAMLSSWGSVKNRVREFTVMMLLLETGMLGVFSSLDMFLFYFFWEAMLIPMYFIIGIWGGQNRIYAAVKFFIYTMLGSLLMLVAIIWLGYYSSLLPKGEFTTDLMQLYNVGPLVPAGVQAWMFLAFTLSFAIKVPLFPFHTWLPDAHVEAPTAGSVILAGVLLKMGTYGLLRFCLPLFPQSARLFMPYISGLAVIGIIYGALVSMVQPDMKKLVAYSSVSHLGFVVLGIFSLTEEGIQGSIIQMVNHGLSTGALFLLVGMLYDRRHTRLISEFGGIGKVMPVFATFLMIVSLSSIGLPGLNGFVGEFLILLGSFRSAFLNQWYSIAGATGVIFAAVYLLWMYQRVVFGSVSRAENRSLRDLSAREIAVLVPVVVFIVWIGVYPGTFMRQSAETSRRTVRVFQANTYRVFTATNQPTEPAPPPK